MRSAKVDGIDTSPPGGAAAIACGSFAVAPPGASHRAAPGRDASPTHSPRWTAACTLPRSGAVADGGYWYSSDVASGAKLPGASAVSVDAVSHGLEVGGSSWAVGRVGEGAPSGGSSVGTRGAVGSPAGGGALVPTAAGRLARRTESASRRRTMPASFRRSASKSVRKELPLGLQPQNELSQCHRDERTDRVRQLLLLVDEARLSAACAS